MPTRKASGKAFEPGDLTPREGKTLRFYVGRLDREDKTPTNDCIVEIAWSDLPHTPMQALQTTGKLKAKGLLAASGSGFCRATEAGVKLIAVANKSNAWQQAPKPRVTNNPVHLDKKLKA